MPGAAGVRVHAHFHAIRRLQRASDAAGSATRDGPRLNAQRASGESLWGPSPVALSAPEGRGRPERLRGAPRAAGAGPSVRKVKIRISASQAVSGEYRRRHPRRTLPHGPLLIGRARQKTTKSESGAKIMEVKHPDFRRRKFSEGFVVYYGRPPRLARARWVRSAGPHVPTPANARPPRRSARGPRCPQRTPAAARAPPGRAPMLHPTAAGSALSWPRVERWAECYLLLGQRV